LYNRITIYKPSGQGEGLRAQFPIGGIARERYGARSGVTPEPTVQSGWKKARPAANVAARLGVSVSPSMASARR